MSTALFTVVKFEIGKATGKCKISGYLRDYRSTSRETHPTQKNKLNDLILNLKLTIQVHWKVVTVMTVMTNVGNCETSSQVLAEPGASDKVGMVLFTHDTYHINLQK